MAKQATGQGLDLAIIEKKMSDNQQQPKAKTIKEYFNYGKKRYLAKDYYSAIKRKSEDEKAILEVKQAK